MRQQRAALVAQLEQLNGQRDDAATALSEAEREFASSQEVLIASSRHLDDINAQLHALSQQIIDDRHTIEVAKTELAGLARAAYESSNAGGVITAVLSASDFGQAVDRVSATEHMDERVRALHAELADREVALTREQAAVEAQRTSATALEQTLSDENNRFMVAVAARDAALANASAPARAVEARIAALDEQIAAQAAPSLPPAHQTSGTGGGYVPPTGGSCGNHFTFGQCTWYVASRRCIPWLGNANAWFANAARMGFSEGHTPVPGAVVVFWPGGDGASGVGHVGYVEAVGPADGIPAGQFKISEMNFAGWDRVSTRILSNNGGIQGFIYGHS